MKRFSQIILAILALIGLAFLGAPLARAVEPPPACPMVSLVSGPAEGKDCATSGGCTYTLHPGPFANIPGTACHWEFPGSKQVARDQKPCADFSLTFTDTNRIGVMLSVGDAQSGKPICQSRANPYNSFNPGDHRVEISPKLEVSYPTLKGPGGQTLTITPLTTPAEYIRYAFMFALTVLGVVAFASLILAGGQWMAGQADLARKRILGVFTGIVLLLGSYLILSYINPELVQPKDPKLPVINISIKPVSLKDVQMCNDAREAFKNGTLTQEERACEKLYTSKGACLDDICSDVRQNKTQPCNWSWAHNKCYTVDNCSEIKKCDDYRTHFGKDTHTACQQNICGVAGDCVYRPDFLGGWVGGVGWCYTPAEAAINGVSANP